jgi:hypothetical protein
MNTLNMPLAVCKAGDSIWYVRYSLFRWGVAPKETYIKHGDKNKLNPLS